jgi:hypothetical protein
MVAPKNSLVGNDSFINALATIAPKHCATMYFSKSFLPNFLATQKAALTAGVQMCPEVSPSA